MRGCQYFFTQTSHKKQRAAAHCAQSLGKSSDSRLHYITPRQASSHLATAELQRRRVPHHRLDLPSTLHHTLSRRSLARSRMHPPIASSVFLARRKMSVRPDGTHVLPGQNRICQNHFFKIQFSFAEKFEGTDVFLILWDSCALSP